MKLLKHAGRCAKTLLLMSLVCPTAANAKMPEINLSGGLAFNSLPSDMKSFSKPLVDYKGSGAKYYAGASVFFPLAKRFSIGAAVEVTRYGQRIIDRGGLTTEHDTASVRVEKPAVTYKENVTRTTFLPKAYLRHHMVQNKLLDVYGQISVGGVYSTLDIYNNKGYGFTAGIGAGACVKLTGHIGVGASANADYVNIGNSFRRIGMLDFPVTANVHVRL